MSWWATLTVALQYLLVVTLAVLAPWLGWQQARELRAYTSAELRLSLLRAGIAQAWIVAAVALALAPRGPVFRIPVTDRDMPWIAPASPGQSLGWWLAVAACLAACVAIFTPGVRCLLDPRARRRYAEAVRPYRFIAPVSREERRRWVAVCLTAGLCEEVIFRGFLLQFLRGQGGSGLHFGLTAAWLASALVFGLGHVYQGAAKAAQIALGGLMLGMAAILTGNLVLPMLLHFLLDLQLLWMYRPAQDEPALAQQLVEGCALR